MPITMKYSSSIFEYPTGTILQQISSTGKKPHGFSKAIVDAFPFANFYDGANVLVPGKISIRKNNDIIIIGLVSQLNIGVCGRGGNTSETSESRMELFRKSLNLVKRNISKFKEPILIPHSIGCGLAGGRWDDYYSIIMDTFKDSAQNIIIISRDPPPISSSLPKKKRIFTPPAEILEDDGDEESSASSSAASSSATGSSGKNSSTSSLKSDIIPNHKFLLWVWDGISPKDRSSLEEKYKSLKLGKVWETNEGVFNAYSKNPKISTNKSLKEQARAYADTRLEKQLQRNQEALNVLTYSSISVSDYIKSTFLSKYKTQSGLKRPEKVSWSQMFYDIIDNDTLRDVQKIIRRDVNVGNIILPKIQNLFKVFDLVKLSKVKCIILGQNPYHSEKSSIGVAFSQPVEQSTLQPSLRNIITCLRADGFSHTSGNGDLGKWINQGVLLLNAGLTVVAGKASSHASDDKYPWKDFTKMVLTYLNENIKNFSVVLWGNSAKSYTNIFNSQKLVIESCHPSAYTQDLNKNNFFDHKPFSRTNEYLSDKGLGKIDWNLD